MISLTEIERVYSSLNNVTEINKDFLLKEILGSVLQINKDRLDENRSLMDIRENVYNVLIIASSDLCIPISFEIVHDNVVDIQIGDGGEYLYYEKINDWSRIKKLRDTINDLLTNTVRQRTIKVNEKAIRQDYWVPYLDKGIRKDYHFFGIYGTSFFWEKKKIIDKTFEAWIN